MPSKAKRPLQSDVMKARAAAEGAVRKALTDAAFRKLLQTNPERALAKAGVPKFALEDAAREIIVDGRAAVVGDCTETCMVTCLITCMITGKGRLPGEEVINPATRRGGR